VLLPETLPLNDTVAVEDWLGVDTDLETLTFSSVVVKLTLSLVGGVRFTFCPVVVVKLTGYTSTSLTISEMNELN